MHRRVRRTPARPRRSRHCIGPRDPDGSAPKSQPDGEGRLVRREPRQRQRAGRHGGRAGMGEVGVELRTRRPSHRSPAAASPPPACSPALPPAALGRLAPPLLPAQPRGGAGPGEPRGGWKRHPQKAQRLALPAAAVGVGATTTPPRQMEGRGPPAFPLPRDRRLSSFNTQYLRWPASQVWFHTAPPPRCTPPSSSPGHPHPRFVYRAEFYLPFKGFPSGSVGKESACNAGDKGDAGLIPGLGRSPGGGNDNPLQYSCLENPVDRGAWRDSVHGITKSRARHG